MTVKEFLQDFLLILPPGSALLAQKRGYKMKVFALLFSVLLTGSLFPQIASAEVTRGAMLANSCAACHGTDGRGSKRIPRLNDLDSADMVELMQGFKEEGADATIMGRHARGYTDEEIKLIAKHFASKK